MHVTLTEETQRRPNAGVSLTKPSDQGTVIASLALGGPSQGPPVSVIHGIQGLVSLFGFVCPL